MSDTKHDYWREAVQCAFEDEGVVLPSMTTQQWDNIGRALASSRENESLAFGYDAIPNPLKTEIDTLNRLLTKERRENETKLGEQEKEWMNEAARLRGIIYELQRERDRLTQNRWSRSYE